MKNLCALIFSFILLFAVGCESTDQELVSQMQGGISTLEGLSVQLKELGPKLTNVTVRINDAPAEAKADPSGGYQETANLATSTMRKLLAVVSQYSDLQNKLNTLSTDYKAGKIKTEEAKKEYEVLQTGIQGLSETLAEMDATADQLQTQYAKMSADWNAKAEEAAQ